MFDIFNISNYIDIILLDEKYNILDNDNELKYYDINNKIYESIKKKNNIYKIELIGKDIETLKRKYNDNKELYQKKYIKKYIKYNQTNYYNITLPYKYCDCGWYPHTDGSPITGNLLKTYNYFNKNFIFKVCYALNIMQYENIPISKILFTNKTYTSEYLLIEKIYDNKFMIYYKDENDKYYKFNYYLLNNNIQINFNPKYDYINPAVGILIIEPKVYKDNKYTTEILGDNIYKILQIKIKENDIIDNKKYTEKINIIQNIINNYIPKINYYNIIEYAIKDNIIYSINEIKNKENKEKIRIMIFNKINIDELKNNLFNNISNNINNDNISENDINNEINKIIKFIKKNKLKEEEDDDIKGTIKFKFF